VIKLFHGPGGLFPNLLRGVFLLYPEQRGGGLDLIADLIGAIFALIFIRVRER
jgi:hypothetical protein